MASKHNEVYAIQEYLFGDFRDRVRDLIGLDNAIVHAQSYLSVHQEQAPGLIRVRLIRVQTKEVVWPIV